MSLCCFFIGLFQFVVISLISLLQTIPRITKPNGPSTQYYMLTKDLYYQYYYPNPTYLIIGYLEPLGNPTADIIRTVKNQMKKKIQKDGDSYCPKPITLNPKPLSPKPPQENLLPQLGIVEAFIR